MFTRFLGSQSALPDGSLGIASVSAATLASEFGTPLYVIDASDFQSRACAFLEACKGAHVSYASKANSALAVLRLALDAGLDVDCASEGELEAALRAGFAPSQITFHGSNKSDDELAKACERGVGTIVLDNFSEIRRLSNIAKTPQGVMVRLAPGVDPETHEAISTGQEDTKFGFNIADFSAAKAVEAVASCANLHLKGYHCHVGSQLADSHAHIAGIINCARFACETRIEIEELNVGGGLGIRYLPETQSQPAVEFCSQIESAARSIFQEYSKMMPRLGYEPGRWLIGEAGTTIYSIGAIKRVNAGNRSRNYVSVDGGLADNPRPQLYGAEYLAANASRISSPHDTEFRVSGRHCETDTLIPRAMLPGDTAECDLLAVQCTGAYNFSMASNYNRYPRPAMVMVSDGAARLAVRRETIDDLFLCEF